MQANYWKKNPVTVSLIAIQVVVFLMMTVMGGSTKTAVLLKFGALNASLVQAGQWWRLITPVFVHIGFAHILINSITLYFIGLYIEQLFGHWRMLVIYFVSAVAGNLLSAFGFPMACRREQVRRFLASLVPLLCWASLLGKTKRFGYWVASS